MTGRCPPRPGVPMAGPRRGRPAATRAATGTAWLATWSALALAACSGGAGPGTDTDTDTGPSTAPATDTAAAAPAPAPSPTPAAPPAESVIVTPPWQLVTTGRGGSFNTAIGMQLYGISDDGQKVAFYSGSGHTFGTGAAAPEWAIWGYLYLRDLGKGRTDIAARGLDGEPLSMFKPTGWLSGSGEVLTFHHGLKRHANSAETLFGVWRATVGTAGHELVSAMGLEPGGGLNGTPMVGEPLRGSFGASVPDRDGNAIAFNVYQLENSAWAPGARHNSTAHFTNLINAVPQLDKGAQPAGKQTQPNGHRVPNTTAIDIDPSGRFVVLGGLPPDAHRPVLWDTQARAGTGALFADLAQHDPKASFTVCGVSSNADKILVAVETVQPVRLADHPTALTTRNFGDAKLLLLDRATGTYQLAAVAERKKAATAAGCHWSGPEGPQRQLSADGTVVAWLAPVPGLGRFGFYVRDMAKGKTVLVPLGSGTMVYQWQLSGNGRHIAYAGDGAPDGSSHEVNGSLRTQVFRIGPISTDGGRAFGIGAFADAHLR